MKRLGNRKNICRLPAKTDPGLQVACCGMRRQRYVGTAGSQLPGKVEPIRRQAARMDPSPSRQTPVQSAYFRAMKLPSFRSPATRDAARPSLTSRRRFPRWMPILLLSATATFNWSCDAESVNAILQTANETLGGSGIESITNAEAVLGIKDALSQGATSGADIVSAVNGYFGNPLIKILLPPEAEPVVDVVAKLPGGQKLLDDATLAINRAAEDAAKEAAPIFVNAITSMSVNDAMGILFGEQDAATQYLIASTTSQLTTKFKPIIDESLGKTGATRYWTDVMNTYNKIPLVKKVDPDLTSFVTTKALEGLFVMVAEEEVKVRGNISARTTPMMKKVFGYVDANR
jgi:hypothetical protein